jgi:predicted AAA+ superfamily ATPase
MYPFSFREYLRFKNITVDANDVFLKEKRAVIKNHFDAYLETGGMPEYIKTGERGYLKTLYDSIIYKDIIVRYGLVKTEKILKGLLQWLYSNTAKEYSYNNLKNIL